MTLLEFERRVAGALMVPLTHSGGIAPTAANGHRTREEAEVLIKSNARLTSLERLEIYSRSYWFRILDSLYEDFPGLRAILGPRAFEKLAEAYLAESPSQSFTLRDLGSRLEEWLRNHPAYGGRNLALALDMVRLEWAHIEAYDNAENKPAGPEDLLQPGQEMRFALQPHLTLLELHYPVDDLRIAVQDLSDAPGVASNTSLRRRERRIVRRHDALKPQKIFLAVHRHNLAVYYRRLEAEEFLILEALRRNIPIGSAVETGTRNSSLTPAELSAAIEGWFTGWARLGWLCLAGTREPGGSDATQL